ncbi:unnamed protein product, partial [Haemonchus placei]|uniref:DB domain-containing protein n=1 Tax=Haemonchus placei TaxID=6290 RepID=A0A0N4VTC8_HAEPC
DSTTDNVSPWIPVPNAEGKQQPSHHDGSRFRSSLVSAFLTNVCPGPQLAHAVECASSKVDHTPCCEKAGLLTFQGGRCLTFCRAHTAQPTNPFEFLPCLQVFEYIKSCYRLYQTTNKNIFGD